MDKTRTKYYLQFDKNRHRIHMIAKQPKVRKKEKYLKELGIKLDYIKCRKKCKTIYKK